MNIEVSHQGTYQRTLRVSIPAADVTQELDVAYKALAKQVRLDGFRKGRAPRKLLETRFAKRIHSDVTEQLVQRSYAHALDQHKLEPVGQPSVGEVQLTPGKPLDFEIKLEVRPTITLTEYRGVEVTYPPVPDVEDQVNAAITEQLTSQARLVEITDRPVQPGDLVMVELQAMQGETPVISEPGTMINTDGDRYYPGVDDLLLGMSLGETKTESIAFSDDCPTQAIAGKTLAITVTVSSIQASVIPELNDETALAMGYEDGADAMREAITKDILDQHTQKARNQAQANLLDVLIERNPFDVPSVMVEHQLRNLIKELRSQRAYAGESASNIQFSPQQIAHFRNRSEFAVKGELILESVAQAESLSVTDDDVETKLQALADKHNEPIASIRGYFTDPNLVEALRARILEEKTLEWLLDHATKVQAEPKDEDSESPSTESKNEASEPSTESPDAPAESR